MKKAAKKKAQSKAKAAPAKKAKRPAAAAKKSKSSAKKTTPKKAKGLVNPATKKKSQPAPTPKATAKKSRPSKKPVEKPATPGLPVAAPMPPPAPVLSSSGKGTPDKPWTLKTPAGFSEFQAYRDEAADPPAIVVRVGKTELRYRLRAIDDLVAMLKAHGDWMPLGSADEQKPVEAETVEAWGRSPYNPVGGWYGLKSGLRGRFATYIPQVLEVLGLAEVEHYPNNNRMRAKS